MSAVLCSVDTLEKILVYAHGKLGFFMEKFGIEKIPSKSTLCRILRMLDPEKISGSILKIMRDRIDVVDEILSVDGKTIRSTCSRDAKDSALHVLTVYGTASGISFKQKRVNKKTNEIPVFQEILNYLNIKGKIITADAMHCQKETCKKIVENGGDYVFGLKGNQRYTYEEAKLFLEDNGNEELIEEFASPIEKEHGRIEQRICKKIKDISWLGDEWSGINSIFSIRRISKDKHQTSDETRYYITSVDAPPQRLMEITRHHWKIESMHWMLDVVFSEDECILQNEEAQLTMNSFRKLALALHKNYIKQKGKKSSISSNMLRCMIDDTLLCSLISNL